MKYNKHVCLLLLITGLIIGLGSVTATDTNLTQETETETDTTHTHLLNDKTVQKNRTQIQENTKQPGKEVKTNTTQKKKIKQNMTNKTIKQTTTINVNNYEELKNTIENANTETIINLNNGTYTNTGEIKLTSQIEKEIVINGNNQTIQGNQQRFLHMRSSFFNIRINNLTITNCSSNNGGAIYNQEGIFVISNLKFINNTSTNIGGAISNHEGTITISNSEFINNTSTNIGGAISNHEGTITILNSEFINNTSTNNGGAIFSEGYKTLRISNSFFINNKVKNNNTETHVITWRYGEISDSYFYNNTDFTRDMLFSTMNGVTTTNTYISNYLETTSDTLNNLTLKSTDYKINIPITINLKYRTIVNNGNITVFINGKEYEQYPVQNGNSEITIPIGAFNQTNNTLVYNYTSPDKSYQPLTLNNTVTIIPENTTTIIEPINGLMGRNVTFKAHVTDINGTLVNEGYVIFKINSVTLKDNEGNPVRVNVTNGTATLTTLATWTKAVNTTVCYSGSNKYEQSRMENGTINIARQNATINMTIQNKDIKPGEKLIAVVNITDMNQKAVNAGNVLFKMNGKTMKYSNGSQVRINVTNGTAILHYQVPLNYSAKNYTLTAVYTGNIYNRAEETTNFTLSKRDAKINMTIYTKILKPGSVLIATADVTDMEGFPVTNGSVIFKLNDKTLRYINGSSIKIVLVNGTATLNYTIPKDYSAKTYKLSAVYTASNYNTIEATQNTTLTKINTYIQPTNVTITGNKLTVKANIMNNDTKEVASERNNTISIKLDKHTIIKEVIVQNGLINLNTTLNNITDGNHTVEIVISGNGIYNSIRQNIIVNKGDKKLENMMDRTEELFAASIDDVSRAINMSKEENIIVKLRDTVLFKHHKVKNTVLILRNGTKARNITIKGVILDIFDIPVTINCMQKQFLKIESGINVTIENIIFKNTNTNSVTIENNGNLLINNSTFENDGNDLLNSVIYNTGILTLNKVNISNCKGYLGGVIYNHGIVTLNEVNINNCKGYLGGVIYNHNGIVTINNGYFIDNTATDEGGIIYNNNGNIMINTTLFAKSTARYGGVIYNHNGNITTLNTKFIDNFAFHGGAIYNHGTVTINNGKFGIIEENKATHGGAIYNHGTLTINNATLLNNTATLNGGAVYNGANGNLIIHNLTIKNNNATYGGAIYNRGHIQTPFTNPNINSTIINNNATYGGAIYNNGTFYIHNTLFDFNKVNSYGGAIYNNGTDFSIDNCRFVSNYAPFDGGAIYNNKFMRLYNTVLHFNRVNQHGGAIYNNGTLTINGGYLNNNKANQHGGAIYNNGTLTINGGYLNNNKANQHGGAIYNQASLTLNNTSLYNNTATWNGGVIYNNNGSVTINNTNMTGNNASEGGALYHLFGNFEIYNSNLSNNMATKHSGVIFIFSGINVIQNTKINNNKAPNGGALYNTGTLTIYNGNINYNRAGYGGAIQNNGILILNNTNLINNNATYGGAIYNNGTLTINNGNLNNNHANYGGAIYNNYGTTEINSTNITKNTAEVDAGAIQNNGILILNKVNLIGNNATYNGGAIYNNGTLTINNGNMNNNTANYGGLVYHFNGDMNLNNSIISNNTILNHIGYVIFVVNGKNNIIRIYNNTFYNNTDYTRDMLINNNKNIIAYNNRYIGNYLESYSEPLQNMVIYYRETEIDIQIPLIIREVYNITPQNGTIQVSINGKDYKNYTVYRLPASILIQKSDFNETINNLTYHYTSQDNSYQPLTLSNTVRILEAHDTVITIDSIKNTPFDKKINITGKLLDANKTEIPNTNLTVHINNKTSIITTDNNGTYSIHDILVIPGTNKITITYSGDEKYNQTNTTVTFTGLKHDTKITVNDINNILFDNKVTVTGVLTDVNNTKISNADVIIIINNVNHTVRTDNNGTYTLNNVIVVPGSNNIQIFFTGNNKYNQAQINTAFIGLKHDTRITVNNITNTLFDNRVTVTGVLTDTNNTAIANATIVINVNGKNNTVRTDSTGKYTLNNVVVTLGNNNVQISFAGNNKYKQTQANTTFTGLKHNTRTTVDPVRGILGTDVTFTAHVNDQNGSSVNEGYVVFKINGVTLKDVQGKAIQVNVTNGTARLTTLATWNNAKNITVLYSGTSKYQSSKIENGTINITRQNATVSITIRNNGLKPGETLISIVNIKDMNGKPVNIGNVLFKMNGKTLKYANGSQVRINVVNGTVTLHYIIPINYSSKNYSLTAVYTGGIYNCAESVKNFTLSRRDATINMTVNKNLKPGQALTATVKITDTKGFPVTNGKVIFKLNGKTLRDAKGNQIKVNVVNGIATLKYTIPNTFNAKTYTLTAVYDAGNYNKIEITQNITLSKINTYIQPTNVTITGNKLVVKANILNNDTKQIAKERTNKISIKIDKKTVIKEVKITNGIINLNTSLKNITKGNHTVEIVTSGNGIYNSSRKNITLSRIKTLIGNPIRVFVHNYADLISTFKKHDTSDIVVDLVPCFYFRATETLVLKNTQVSRKIVLNGYDTSINLNQHVFLSIGKGNDVIVNNLNIENGSELYYGAIYNEGQLTINCGSMSKTYITADNIEAQLGNKITINATIRNSNNKTIDHGKIAIKINGKTFGYTNITSNGQIRYNLELTPEKFGKYTYKVTIVYGGTQNTPSAHKTIQLKIIPYRTIIELPETISYLTDTTVFNVKVTNQTGYNAHSGNIGFKINGLTYKINKKAYIVKLNNGTVALKFNTSRKYVGKNNITITYSGNSQFNSVRITFTDIYIVKNSNRTIINTHPAVSRIGENITLTAKFTDKNNNSLPRGKVAVKINGRTFGYAQIINGTAAYTQYLNPTKFSGKKYIITYTFGGINKYSPARTNTTLTINKLLPEITYNTTTINNTTSIIIKIKNSNINANSGTIGLKINQKTIKKENKTYILKPVNGTVTFTLNNTDISNKNLTITYSGNNLFYNGRITYSNGQQVQNTTRTTSLFVQRREKITDKTVNTWIKNGITDVYIQAQASANDTKLLKNVITLTNNTDIKVHAWIICFYKDKKFNLNVSQQNMIKNFVSKVVRINGLSGVCLDYVRYDGKNQSTVNQSLITNFVKSVNTIIKQYNKSIELSACLFPEKTATAKYYGQNYTALSPYLDVELIMAYKYDYNKNSTWLKDVTSYVVRNAPYSRVVTVLQTYDREYKLLSDIELVDDIVSVINSKSDGYGLFRYGLISNYPIDARRIPC